MEQVKLNVINLSAFIASMFLTNIEAILSVAVLTTALIYNLIKIYKQNK